jgi:hypothetical protein
MSATLASRCDSRQRTIASMSSVLHPEVHANTLAREDAAVTFPERFDELLQESTLLACSVQSRGSGAGAGPRVCDLLLASEQHAVLYAGCRSIVPLHPPAIPTFLLAADGGRIPLDVDTRITCAATVGGLAVLGDASGYLHLFCAACMGADAAAPPLLSQQLLPEPIVHVSGSTTRGALGGPVGGGGTGGESEDGGCGVEAALCAHSSLDTVWVTFASGAVASLAWRDIMAAAADGVARRLREHGMGQGPGLETSRPPPLAAKVTKWHLPGQRRIACVEATNPPRGRLADALWSAQIRWGRAQPSGGTARVAGQGHDHSHDHGRAADTGAEADTEDDNASYVTLVAGGADPSVCMYHAPAEVNEAPTAGEVASAVAARVTSAVSTAVLRIAADLNSVMPAAVARRLDPVGASTWMVGKLAGWMVPDPGSPAGAVADAGAATTTAAWTGTSAGGDASADDADAPALAPALHAGNSEGSRVSSGVTDADSDGDDAPALAGGDAATSAQVRVMQAAQARPLSVEYELVDGARRIEKVSAREPEAGVVALIIFSLLPYPKLALTLG